MNQLSFLSKTLRESEIFVQGALHKFLGMEFYGEDYCTSEDMSARGLGRSELTRARNPFLTEERDSLQDRVGQNV